MSVIFYTLATLYGYGRWGGVDSKNFAGGAFVMLILFVTSYGIHYEQLSIKKRENHHNYNECVRLNIIGLSTKLKLEMAPQAKQLCSELYNESI